MARLGLVSPQLHLTITIEVFLAEFIPYGFNTLTRIGVQGPRTP